MFQRLPILRKNPHYSRADARAAIEIDSPLFRRRFGPTKIRGAGFTLIELLVVFAIIGLVVALVPMAGSKVRDAVLQRDLLRQIATELRSARSTAIKSGSDAVVTIDIDQRLVIFPGGDSKIRLSENTVIRLDVAVSETQGSSQGAIRFFKDGSSTGGTIELERGNARKIIEVDWLSGRVQVKALVLHDSA